MNEYNFNTLNDKDFEILVRDLLNEELELDFQSYKKGKDKGIDLYHEGPDRTNIIVQVKHWIRTPYSGLIRELEKNEKNKVLELSPDRYIFATSVALSLENKRKILSMFNPYIKSINDIYGFEDINKLISKFPKIENKHYKLWFSSTNILQQIINNGSKQRSDFLYENIKRDISIYVFNSNYKIASRILSEQNFLVILGQPGIGKSLLAKVLTANLLSKGYSLVDIQDIENGNETWVDGEKQIFFFDDFLGANYLQIRNNDSQILNFLKRVKLNPEKKIILTSRTIILRQAQVNLQKLDDEVFDLSEHEIMIEDYNKYDKAKILYNHLYFKELPIEFFDKIKKDRNYIKIIEHKNFNPRIIDFVTDKSKLSKSEISPEEYLDFILSNLDKPDEIWRFPYEKQIDDYSRFILNSLLTLEISTGTELEHSFNERLSYEIKNNHIPRPNNIFNQKIKELLGGFIQASRDEHEVKYSFFNPSIIDFLVGYLNDSSDEKWRVLNSLVYIQQFTHIFETIDLNKKKIIIKQNEIERLYALILGKESVLLNRNNISERNFELIELYYRFFEPGLVKKDITRLFEALNFKQLSQRQLFSLGFNIAEYMNTEWEQSIIVKNWDIIIYRLFEVASEKKDFENIKRIFEKYNMDLRKYNKEIIRRSLKSLWNTEEEFLKQELTEFANKNDIESHINYRYEEALALNEDFGVEDIRNIFNFTATDFLMERELEYEKFNQMYHEGYIDIPEEFTNGDIEDENYDDEIDSLFS
jgi:hypothetical protein